jgi:hypothetical protein
VRKGFYLEVSTVTALQQFVLGVLGIKRIRGRVRVSAVGLGWSQII